MGCWNALPNLLALRPNPGLAKVITYITRNIMKLFQCRLAVPLLPSDQMKVLCLNQKVLSLQLVVLQKPAGVVGEVSLQSNPVEREILPEGLSGGILDFYSLSVYLQAPEHLPRIDAVLPDLLQPVPELHCQPVTDGTQRRERCSAESRTRMGGLLLSFLI